jgi:hypothetical protein
MPTHTAPSERALHPHPHPAPFRSRARCWWCVSHSSPNTRSPSCPAAPSSGAEVACKTPSILHSCRACLQWSCGSRGLRLSRPAATPLQVTRATASRSPTLSCSPCRSTTLHSRSQTNAHKQTAHIQPVRPSQSVRPAEGPSRAHHGVPSRTPAVRTLAQRWRAAPNHPPPQPGSPPSSPSPPTSPQSPSDPLLHPHRGLPVQHTLLPAVPCLSPRPGGVMGRPGGVMGRPRGGDGTAKGG